MKYIEIGLGNRWFIRTEIEYEDGSESEVKGILRPFRLQSIYIRLWVGRRVFVIDSKEGFKQYAKSRKKLKLILGFRGL